LKQKDSWGGDWKVLTGRGMEAGQARSDGEGGGELARRDSRNKIAEVLQRNAREDSVERFQEKEGKRRQHHGRGREEIIGTTGVRLIKRRSWRGRESDGHSFRQRENKGPWKKLSKSGGTDGNAMTCNRSQRHKVAKKKREVKPEIKRRGEMRFWESSLKFARGVPLSNLNQYDSSDRNGWEVEYTKKRIYCRS